MEDTIWFWNDWREVEFRSGGKFFAPDADNCHDGTPALLAIKVTPGASESPSMYQ